MKAFWTYTLARLAVFSVTFSVVWLAGSVFFESTTSTTLLLLLVAAVLSSIISIFLLASLRENLALHIQQRATRMSERIEKARSAEDVD